MFSTLSRTNFKFSVTFILSSAHVFNLDGSKILSSAHAFSLDRSKILSSGKELK